MSKQVTSFVAKSSSLNLSSTSFAKGNTMNTRMRVRSVLTMVAAIFAVVAMTAAESKATTYNWTGAVNGDWTNAGNWAPGVPVDTRPGSAALDLDAANDKLVFDASAAANPVPTSNIPSFGWYAFQGTADVPIVDMFDGSLSVTGNGAFQQGFGGNSGTTWATVGDGDANAASLTYSNYVYLGRSGVGNWVVNADGTLNFTGVSFVGFSTNSGPGNPNAGRIMINGGSVVLDAEVHDLVATQANATPAYVEFNTLGSSFTAEFATSGTNDFANLAAVTSQFGASFRNTTSFDLVAVDNGNGTFTVSLAAPPAPAPEPSTMILAALGVVGLLGTRRRRNR